MTSHSPLQFRPSLSFLGFVGVSFPLSWWLLGEPLREPLMATGILGALAFALIMVFLTFFIGGILASGIARGSLIAHLPSALSGLGFAITFCIFAPSRPGVAFLLAVGILSFPAEMAGHGLGRLVGISQHHWELNQKSEP